MQRKLMKLILAGMVVMMIAAALPLMLEQTHAQGANLLLNPSFELAVTHRGGVDGRVPINWEFWWTGERPFTDKDDFGPYVRSAPQSWVWKREYTPMTAAGWQTATVESGKAYRASAHAFIWTCNNDPNPACRNAEGTYSDPSANARVRIGVDPTGGTDPNSANIIWSPFASPYQDIDKMWGEVSVVAEATSDRMTVFLYFTSSGSLKYTEVHWDDVALVATDGSVPPQPGAVAPPPPTPADVPFVVPQQPRPNGSLVHTVQAQDTIDSIMVAYRDLYAELGLNKEDLYTFNNWRFPPDIIVIGQEIVILPPGSLDPETGELLIAGITPIAPTATPIPTAAATEAAAEPTAAIDPVATAVESETEVAPETEATPEGETEAEATPAPAATQPPVNTPTPLPPVNDAVSVITPFLPEGSIAP